MLTETIAQPELFFRTMTTYIHFLLLNKFRVGNKLKSVSAVSVLGEYWSPEKQTTILVDIHTYGHFKIDS